MYGFYKNCNGKFWISIASIFFHTRKLHQICQSLKANEILLLLITCKTILKYPNKVTVILYIRIICWSCHTQSHSNIDRNVNFIVATFQHKHKAVTLGNGSTSFVVGVINKVFDEECRPTKSQYCDHRWNIIAH